MRSPSQDCGLGLPVLPDEKTLTPFDDLRSHLWAVHWRGQSLHPPKASLKRLDWWEEREDRKHNTDTDQDWTRTRRVEKRSCSHQGRTPSRKVVKKDPSPAVPSLGSLGESPGLLLSLLPPTPSPKKRTPRRSRPSAAVSKPPEEVVEPSLEEPAQLPPEHVAPEDIPAEDLAPRAITLQTRKSKPSSMQSLPQTPGRPAFKQLCFQQEEAFIARHLLQGFQCPRILMGV